MCYRYFLFSDFYFLFFICTCFFSFFCTGTVIVVLLFSDCLCSSCIIVIFSQCNCFVVIFVGCGERIFFWHNSMVTLVFSTVFVYCYSLLMSTVRFYYYFVFDGTWSFNFCWCVCFPRSGDLFSIIMLSSLYSYLFFWICAALFPNSTVGDSFLGLFTPICYPRFSSKEFSYIYCSDEVGCLYIFFWHWILNGVQIIALHRYHVRY